MPYIPQEYRSELNPSIDALCRKILTTKSDDDSGATAGMLNYAITRMILSLLPENARYRDYNAMIGMLHCCALELYASHVGQYEMHMACENGPVEPMKRGKHGKKKLRYKRRR